MTYSSRLFHWKGKNMIIKSTGSELDFNFCEFDLDKLNETEKQYIVSRLTCFMDLIEDIICTDKIPPETINDLLYVISKHSRESLKYFNERWC